MSDKAKSTAFLLVVSALATLEDGGEPIALFEKHAAHPDGQAFVTSPTKPVEVAETPKVREAITKGLIKEYTESESETDEVAKLPEIFADDTAESLKERLSRAEIIALAKAGGVEFKTNESTLAIATRVLEAADANKE